MDARAVWAAWRWRLDVWRFAGRRVDYFDYLHAVLQGVEGGLTLRELFERDARRYGPGTVRGRLSQHWARACEAAGGDLYATWHGCFPVDELVLIRAAQAFGNARLLACFQALARHLGLLSDATRIVWTTLGVAAAAALVASLLVLALPAWTVPALQRAFQGLPPDYQGGWSRALFNAAGALRDWGPLIPMAILGAAAACLYTLPVSHGPWRRRLDRLGFWRLYRQLQSLRLLALVGILLQPGAGGSAQLRPVITLFLPQSRPWLAAHLRAMLWRIDHGLAGPEAFRTGLLDDELYWYLQDMAEARGLVPAISMAHARLSALWLTRIRGQAQALRWGVLLCGVMVVLGLGLWHYAAIDELRRGWMMFHAGQ